MKPETAKALVEAAESLSIECRLYEDYSGRGMYGKTTTGVVVGKWADVVCLAAEAAGTMGQELGMKVAGEETSPDDASTSHDALTDFLYDLRTLRSDNLGHDTIIY